jgi:collagenase-like PrtC family protease
MELLNAGLERITASYDLNANGIATLAAAMGKSQSQHLEVVAHMKMPIFHTEHCVFARFLSNGNSYLDCGHVCTHNNVHLRDQTGLDNLVLADMGCRNTVFAAQAQSGVQSVRQWVEAGVGRIRVELVDEGAEDAETIVAGYIGVLAGTTKPSVVWESLQYMRDSNGRAAGVSLGSFRNTKERKAGAL